MTGLTLGNESALLGFDFSPYVRFGRVAAELGGQSSWAGTEVGRTSTPGPVTCWLWDLGRSMYFISGFQYFSHLKWA